MYKNRSMHQARGNGHLTQTIAHPSPTSQGRVKIKKISIRKLQGVSEEAAFSV